MYIKYIIKLQLQINRIHKGKKYKKIVFVIPSKIIQELKWRGDEEVDAKIEGDTLIITKK